MEESRRYSDSANSRGKSYDFAMVNPYLKYNVTQRADLQLGAYGSRYRRTDGANTTDASGISLDLTQNWTQLFTTTASVKAERDTINQTGVPESRSTNWSANLSMQKRGELDTFRMDAGRELWPSASGYKTQNDQIQFQYTHPFSQRLEFGSALRGIKVRQLGAVGQDDRDYFVGEVILTWALSMRWSVVTSYDYTWQKFIVSGTKAHDNDVSLAIQYRGLKPQRR
jgi:predicted porin